MQKGVVGINMYSLWFYPFTNSAEDIQEIERTKNILFGWILHPSVFGDYPETMKKAAGSRLASFSNHESELVRGAFDFIGLNHYSSVYASNNPDALKMGLRDLTVDIATMLRATRDEPPTEQFLPGKMIDPQGLQHVLEYLKEKYGNMPVYIQENGCAQTDDTVNDVGRIYYLEMCMASTLNASRNGANVKGYFVWSFVDLYELFGGYQSRFGLVGVDFDTDERQRQPRLSAHWYSDFLKKRSEIKIEGNFVNAASHAQF